MADLLKQYKTRIDEILDAILENESDKITQAAELLANAIAKDKLVNIFGAGGHSSIAAMEVFYRAGGLVPINPMFPPGMDVINSHPTMARLPGTGKYILNFYRVKPDEPVVVVNFYGLTSGGLDTAIEAKERGMPLITINSHQFSAQIPRDWDQRHPSQKNLHELADVAIDNHVPMLDAVLELPEVELRMTATATMATVFVINCLMTRTAEHLVKLGHTPEVWLSNNVPGGDQFNKQYVDKYMPRIHHLYPTW